ncbi:hypothetical protein GCM10011581_14030 [Saccharopolyspora subtropica]|uniref:Uncharacterized protein n=1 Tax=Saccharopolyspora thermophila TaxID=89367 RepID=A0A917N8N7_9PSEU|nr:hypothetical protein GCM10011581_14030 [Saccharopolyspora subtropica]
MCRVDPPVDVRFLAEPTGGTTQSATIEIGVCEVRSSVRALFAGVAAAGMLAMGATPALAAKDSKKESDDDSTVTAAAEGGDGGNGGNGGFALNICPAIGILAKAEADCSAANGGDANGGDADAWAEDDSNEIERYRD